jgi:hypothetical protein
MTSCSVAGGRLHFGLTYCLHLQSISTLIVGAVHAPETLVPTYQILRCHNAEDHNRYLYHRENPISYDFEIFFHSLE